MNQKEFEAPAAKEQDTLAARPVSLEDVLITGQLSQRDSRPPDYEAENRALHTLSRALADDPDSLLQKLVEVILELIPAADSAGVSNYLPAEDGGLFRWVAVAGLLSENEGHSVPGDQSPCGSVIDRDEVLLFDRPGRYFELFLDVEPAIVESLLVPFHIEGEPVGTVWAISHDADRRFDAEDRRLLTSLSQFASAGYQFAKGARLRDELRERVRTRTTELERAEGEARRSRRHLQAIFDHSLDAILLADDEGRYVDANEAATELLGYTVEELCELSVWDLTRRQDQENGRLTWRGFVHEGTLKGEYTMVRKDGTPVETEFRATANIVPGLHLSIIRDITERKQSEAALRRSEERQRFLLELSDMLRPLADPVAIQRQAARVLGEHLNVDRAHYGEILAEKGLALVREDYTRRDVPSAVGEHRLDDAGEHIYSALQAGETVVRDDLAADPELTEEQRAVYQQLEARSLVAVPLIKGGRFHAYYIVTQAEPREWTDAEVEIVEETAQRTWAAVERARAEEKMGEAQERYLALFNAIDQGFCTIEVAYDENDHPIDYRFVEVSPAFSEQTGIEDAEGRWMRDIAQDQDEHWFEIYGRVARERQPERFESYSTPLGRWWYVYAFPIGEPEERRIGVLFSDITDRKRAEQALRESEARLAAELEATKQLQSISAELIQEEDIDALYEQIIDAAIRLMDSDFASIQAYNPERNELELLAWRGFHPEAAASWARVRPDGSSVCSLAISKAGRVVVPDVEAHDSFAGTARLEVFRLSGIRSVQSTPLISRSGDVVGMISTHWAEPHEPSEQKLRVFDVLARQAADLIERTSREEELRELNETLEERVRRRTETSRELASRLTMAEQEERRRISQILHDDLQQLLFGIQLKMSLILRDADLQENGRLQDRMKEATRQLENAIATTRNLAVDLSPPVLQGEGLTDTLQWLKSQMKDLHALEVEIEAEHAFRIPDEDMRVLLFQIVRELLFNVVKHAETDCATVELLEEDGRLVMCVTDEGQGFDVEAAEAEQERNEGFGLFSVRERLALFGGRMEVDSEPGDGTCVTVYTSVEPAP